MILLLIAIFIGLSFFWCRASYKEKEFLELCKGNREGMLSGLDPKSKISPDDFFNSIGRGDVTKFINSISRRDYGRIISNHYEIQNFEREIRVQKLSFNCSIYSMVALIITFLILL